MARVIKVAVARVVRAITANDAFTYNNTPATKAFKPPSAGIAFTAPTASDPILIPTGGNIIVATITAATVIRMIRFVVLYIGRSFCEESRG